MTYLSTERASLFTASEVEERTGVAANTLRQWERRYGLPKPERALNGYRLYSSKDIQCIEFIQQQLRSGINISRAVDMFKQTTIPADVQYQYDAEHLAELVLKQQHQEATYFLTRCYGAYPLEMILLKIIVPCLEKIGTLWYTGKITVAHEHSATHFLRNRLYLLFDLLGEPSFGRHVVIACVPSEEHDIGALILSILLRRKGLRVHFLGANVPIGDVLTFSREINAHMLLLSMGVTSKLSAIQSHLPALKNLKIPVIWGGSMINQKPELLEHLTGQYLGSDTLRAVDTIVELLDTAC